MGYRIRPLAAAITVAFSASALSPVTRAEGAATLGDVIVSGARPQPLPTAVRLEREQLAPLSAAAADSAGLLRGVAGVSLQGAGGVSSLPSIHGLGDDRLRIRVDGMDLISACANHMNPPLSYIDPSNLAGVEVHSGIVPVSLGGDSSGGTIVASSPLPRFAAPGEGLLSSGESGGYYRSNGHAFGYHLNAELASQYLSIRYAGASTQSDNYRSAKAFKPEMLATYATAGNHVIAGDEVGATAYKTENHQLGFAWRRDAHLLDLKLGYQHIPYQGFPNQHMDMTDNRSAQLRLGYRGRHDWGRLQARVYHEETEHAMNFMADKLYWYHGSRTIPGMPMQTAGRTSGLSAQAEVILSARYLLRLGGDYQRHRLADWWPASYGIVGGVPVGGMQPDTFWNINDGRRDRFDLFGEWEATWSPAWTTQLGARGGLVRSESGTVSGYNSSYAADAAAFNSRDRRRDDYHLDLSFLARHTPNATVSYEGGYSRKTRSPSLYERYTWSTGMMAMTMNNWLNDGNGYVGNPDLSPEIAHTVSIAADWHDPARQAWSLRAQPWYSRVDNYIDARCLAASCPAGQYNYLTLSNQDDRLYGLDLDGFAAFGDFVLRGTLGYANGKNRDSGDRLYNIMPLNLRLALEHRLGQWTNVVEQQLVAAKDEVSQTHSEVRTTGYGLLNLRSSYQWQQFRLDLGIDNALDRQYALPLGGAYIGQGMTMSIGGSTGWSGLNRPPYGYAVPGMGRSLYAGISLRF